MTEQLDRPDGVLARRTTAEVASGDQHGSRLDRHLARPHPVEEQELAVPRALDPLQELLWDDLIGVNVGTVEHRDVTGYRRDRLHQLHSLISTKCPSTTRAASRKSSMREFVHDPMKTRSSAMSVIAVPGWRPMYASARSAVSAATVPASSGVGTRPVTSTTMPGDVPHVTTGESAEASTETSSSKRAPASVGSVCHLAVASSQSLGAARRPSI